jgi:hypothetical protein
MLENMMGGLPGWVIDDVSSVRDEVKEWLNLSCAERWQLAILCSRDAIWALQLTPDPELVLAYVDPLPESSVAALNRLRQPARETP